MGNPTGNVDNTVPGNQWQFDESVTDVFDNMLERSIPQYDVMRKTVTNYGARYIRDESVVVDLGCSRGGAIATLIERFPVNRFIGIEVSEPMRKAAQDRFKDCPNVSIRDEDLRETYPPELASLTLAVLTVQFVPIEYRHRIIRNVYKHTVSGGAFIMVEKVLGSTAEIDADMVSMYYSLKGENGYTSEQIQRKRLSLEGVLVPVTARWNEELLRAAGFQQIDCIWRWMNFAAWIAVKE